MPEEVLSHGHYYDYMLKAESNAYLESLQAVTEKAVLSSEELNSRANCLFMKLGS